MVETCSSPVDVFVMGGYSKGLCIIGNARTFTWEKPATFDIPN
jgi:hypothetical protein